MSFERVKEYFERVGLGDRIVEREQIGATVEQAAMSVGCEPARIAKTMSVSLDEKPALIVMAGDAKIDNTKYTIILPSCVMKSVTKVAGFDAKTNTACSA